MRCVIRARAVDRLRVIYHLEDRRGATYALWAVGGLGNCPFLPAGSPSLLSGAMIDLKLDLSVFEELADRMDAARDQIPFALAGALNDAAFTTRTEFIQETWPHHIRQRNASFMRAVWHVGMADKHNLVVRLYDQLGREFLVTHDRGGVKRPYHGGRLAIPVGGYAGARRTSGGAITEGWKPRNLPGAFIRNNAIFMRVGKKNVQMVYVLKPSANIRPDVPFTATFKDFMEKQALTAFPARMVTAMMTRR